LQKHHRRALATPGPVVVDAIVDPFEPPVSPKVEPKQVKNFARALARGEPNRKKIALTVISDKVSGLV
jgi:pyruvate dehydrogenase (quinone)